MKSRFHRGLAAAALVALFACAFGLRAAADGPPFVTDDPEPVSLHHWEAYVSMMYQHGPPGSFGTLPHIEINNGVAPNTQLHIILPMAFAQAPSAPMAWGYGDTEVGVKYRFMQEGRRRPMAGIFPLVEVPTGNQVRGLGSGHLQIYLPIWFQKSWGAWTSYGGGGYWINPGAGNRNWWFGGWLLQKDLNRRLTLGGELFASTSSGTGQQSQFDFNLGGQYNFDDGHHLLFSAGRSIRGSADLMAYVGFQWTFGPHSRQ
ncbi:MAG: hypothetical protein KGJ62_05550 [Armatimonadetes bacterium]|nr:hypothetical protein [Armatimonadota bacterium]MDE2207560.1 hypothetical protein [Armatimonadota bacterium]